MRSSLSYVSFPDQNKPIDQRPANFERSVEVMQNANPVSHTAKRIYYNRALAHVNGLQNHAEKSLMRVPLQAPEKPENITLSFSEATRTHKKIIFVLRNDPENRPADFEDKITFHEQQTAHNARIVKMLPALASTVARYKDAARSAAQSQKFADDMMAEPLGTLSKKSKMSAIQRYKNANEAHTRALDLLFELYPLPDATRADNIAHHTAAIKNNDKTLDVLARTKRTWQASKGFRSRLLSFAQKIHLIPRQAEHSNFSVENFDRHQVRYSKLR